MNDDRYGWPATRLAWLGYILAGIALAGIGWLLYVSAWVLFA